MRLRSQLRALTSNVASAVGVGILALMMLPGIVALTVGLLLTGSIPEWRPVAMVLAGTTVVTVWLLGSVIFFAMDDSLAPSRLSLLPLRPGQLSLPLVLTDLATLPGIFTLIVSIGLIGGWATGTAELLAAVVMTPLGLLTGLVSGRILVTALGRILNNRRSRDVMYVVIVLLFVALAWLPSLLASSRGITFELSPAGFAPMADLLAWTPLGAPWALPGAVAVGAWGTAGAQLLVTVSFLAVLWVVWTWQLGRSLVSPLPSSGAAEEQVSWPWLDRLLPGSPAGTVAARILRQYRRDPRRFLSLIMISLLPLFVILVQQGTSELPLGPALPWLVVTLVTWVSGLGCLQDTSYDGSALWTHAVSGIRGRDDRLGRLIGNAVLLCPSLCLTAVVAVWATDQWAVLPALLGLGSMVLLIGAGIGLFVSVFLTGTLPPPGSSPFASSMKGQGSAFLAVLLHSLCLSVVLALCVLLVLGLRGAPWLGWVYLVVGPLVGGVAAHGLCRWAGRCLDQRWPELVHAVTYEK
ncbi:hypothetical protein EII34_01930 [Arachnia propionica]|uniref:Uncharacterized protein n=1 Tax=Arachnia propionica TaxID=1750 RepID=A0A3P1TCU4_9ACTN|nr:hypothetical protein [Arachnia propionica]RRD07267.1 hypothetical protein EII34_01930 [Arachnia propionica]